MDEYIKRRRHIRKRLGKAKNKLESSDEVLSLGMYEIIEEQLQELWSELKTCADDIMTTCDSDEEDEHDEAFDEIFDEFDAVKLLMKTKLSAFSRLDENQDGGRSSRFPRNHSNGDSVKLPKLELPSFGGSYLEWTAFADLFRASVHCQALSGAQKLQYLRGALRGEALQLIQGYSISNANYTEAWNVLQKRYQNSRELVRTQIVKFITQPYLKEKNAVDLRSLVDTSTSCLLALRTMGYETAVHDENYWIAFLMMERLDPETRELWESKLGRTAMPKWSELMEFLDERVSILSSSTADVKQAVTKKIPEKKQVIAHQVTTNSRCILCSENHLLYQCKKFIDMNIDDRKKFVREKQLCFNCLKPGHAASKCGWGGTCRKCKQKHSTLLHAEATPPTDSVSAHTVTASNRALMATALVSVENGYGESYEFRALLDPGADVDFISEDAAQLMRLNKTRTDVSISGVGESDAGVAKYSTGFIHRSKIELDFVMPISAYIIPKVTCLLPKHDVLFSEFSHLKNVTLADPTFHKTGSIDLLLGADVFFEIIRDGRIHGKSGHPIGQQTVWGYVVGGKCPSQAIPKSISVHHIYSQMDELHKYWELEEIPRKQILTAEDRECEDHFVKTRRRSAHGRYIVRLPFREKVPALGISVNVAEKRLKLMEEKLASDVRLKQQYVQFMREYIALGHMELISADEVRKTPDQAYYLPHHAVIKEDSSTTKLRVVFDASAFTSSKISLNDRLMTGTKLQDDLFDFLVRFRLFPVAMKADIGKMFRQIWVSRNDCDFQRILWRETPEDPIGHYRLLTVTYGTSVAPYLAKRCLEQLAIDEAENFPDASKVTLEGFYMDDLMSSQQNIQSSIQIQQQLISMMKKGGFDLRKWISNSTEVLEAVPPEMRETELPFRIDESDSVKTLGLSYHPLFDHFKFHVNAPKIHVVVTKRTISSDIGKVFDPIGWLSPVTISAKILFQKLWQAKLGWDEAIGEDLETKWRRYSSTLAEIEKIRIPRCLFNNVNEKFNLYCFSDASESAYGAVIYIKAEGSVPQILAAKTKVAPTKQVSLPRLELCASLLLARLLDAITYAMKCKPNKIYAWTDSMIVLHWLESHPTKWKTFVANRVSEIQDIIPFSCWHHVPGIENPADCISRGIMADELRDHPLWWHGPLWLTSFPDGFQDQPICIDASVDIEARCSISSYHAKVDVPDFTMLHNYSSLPKLLRITALLFRFGKRRVVGAPRTHGSITVRELRDALHCWIRLVQKAEFAKEFESIQQGKSIECQSKILTLSPFMDAEVLMRVGGRLKKANIPSFQKHPLLLPKKHRLVELIILHEHLISLHAGPQLVLSNLHRRYWILGGRAIVQKLLRQCVICCRHRSEIAQQMMGELPHASVNPVRAFLKTGVDYAGPITLRVIKGKGHKFYKGYIFICFVTRAIHVELVTDLSSAAFVKALRRFCGRRGKPSDLYCDNGRTFVGAHKQLQFTKSKEYTEIVSKYLAEQAITFHHIPPSAPHFGGLWEAGIKSLKYHLKRVVGNEILNYEEMSTLLIQIEACLNSRPLTSLSKDPTDMLPLTPGHFLIGESLTAPADSTLVDESTTYVNNWKRIQRMYQNFWRRWSCEYLTRLQQRPKWLQQKQNIELDELVLIKAHYKNLSTANSLK